MPCYLFLLEIRWIQLIPSVQSCTHRICFYYDLYSRKQDLNHVWYCKTDLLPPQNAPPQISPTVAIFMQRKMQAASSHPINRLLTPCEATSHRCSSAAGEGLRWWGSWGLTMV
ncbi:hypothetical protein BDBG_00913 [Blastomyces gilchristii SLH14081]|uniref:Uncharacterized protein n=1 Tax=Blastomyces gilchristii (strain SLH14081) TaxID=559298 RepID=A0A179UAL9_BLAGS|nr:uncharacterized protein BDBG_00913 [Blastomyces gilchristii SLH14081]OAT04339.1 hypothetical protein BDBG_00913 [Blastomyces gilchristii SLH14081]